jgi:hypothetical protein
VQPQTASKLLDLTLRFIILPFIWLLALVVLKYYQIMFIMISSKYHKQKTSNKAPTTKFQIRNWIQDYPTRREKSDGLFTRPRADEDLAIRTNTEIITMTDGKIVPLTAEVNIKRGQAEIGTPGTESE